MSNPVDEYFLKLACDTALPGGCTTGRNADNAAGTRPYTRAQAKIQQQSPGLPTSPLKSAGLKKKRGRKSNFEIFIDVNGENTTPAPSPKKPKPNDRVPLAVRMISANTTPAAVPRRPHQPFPFSLSDPLWEDVENYDARACYLTPPPTPGRDYSIPGQPPHTPRGFSSGPPPSPSSTPRPLTPTIQPWHAAIVRPLPSPLNTILYDALALNSWNATEDEIKAAYKNIAKDNHPDKVAAAQQGDATQFMQTVNAAKEVLLDRRRRRKYHKTGKLPWTT